MRIPIKAFLHIPSGLIFYHFTLDYLLTHKLFNNIFGNWFPEAFEEIPVETLKNDFGFNIAKIEWENTGIHRTVRQCSLFIKLDTGYFSDREITNFVSNML